MTITLNISETSGHKAFYQKMITLSWLEQIKYILDLEMNGEEVDFLKVSYEAINKRLFSFDKSRYMYSFLAGANMVQAVSLYECFTVEDRYIFVSVIAFDHPHLHQVIKIHNYIEARDAPTATDVIQ